MTTATPRPLVKPLFDLPASIHRIGFVEILSEAITRPQATASTYVVTPAIADAFDKALRLVSTSLRTGRSQASFLHGSFGSGKSHFMALLSLMLTNAEDAWRVPELHPLRAKHPWIGTKSLLQLHFHVAGNDANLEGIIFRKYLAHVRAHHPDAPVPGVFADERLFDDARKLLGELGDDAFFAPMNQSIAPATASSSWGQLARKTWDRERFEHAASSTEPETRQTLFSALVKTRFGSFAEEARSFVDLDAGLATIGRHAKALGYDGVVLFLDELILWLASRASNVEWFHNEVQKMVKLVESQDSHREIPFVSFIARQRDLAEMVGEDYLGSDDKRVRDSLKWSEGRYETITLEDRNLPAIVEKRVLRPRDDAAKDTLAQAFATLERGAKASWKTMLGQLDAQAFRQLYPFSPALVDALVALSNSLQRERTAIKLLTELLVEHIEDLPVGGVVGVGDLYDVLAGGEDTADGIMKSRFEAAKHVYAHRLLPLLQQTHGTDRPDACQRLRPEHPARLGCSNCPQTRCRADNRLVKTLIIAALVPEVGALKDMTASRLVQLNHGSLTVPIAGTEASVVAQRLRQWASELGQLHVGPGTDPTVRLQLEGVELGPILEQAKHVDTPGAQQRVLKDLLFRAMGLEAVTDWGKDDKRDWRGTTRPGHIRFGNVRKMGPETLRCPEGHDWRLIVDYPFDDEGFGPHDDQRIIEQFADEHGSWTLVWLPSFFSHAMRTMLGELVILEHILDTRERALGFVGHLSVDNQARALNDLENLRTQKQSRVLAALEQAYGLVQPKEGDLDPSRSVEQHLHVLMPGAQLQPGLAASLATALDAYVPALLEARYPRHPRLAKPLTPKRVDELVERFGAVIDAPDKRIPVDKALGDELRGTLGELGLLRVLESGAHLLEDRTLQELERRRAQAASERPEVGEIRRFIDPTGKMGLQQGALDLIVRCYARYTARTFVSGDQAYTPTGKTPIPEYVVLDKPDLPSPSAWVEAIAVAGDTLGMSFPGRALHADNLERWRNDLRKILDAKADACARLPALLQQRADALGVPADADRLVTARSAATLLAALVGRPAKEQVEQLAAFEAKTSRRAVGASVGSAERLLAVLRDNLVFGAFEQLRGRAAELPGAAERLEEVAATLRQDELNAAAAERLRALAEQAQAILNPPPLPGRVLYEGSLRRGSRAEVLARLRALVDEVERATEGLTAPEAEALAMTGQIRITVPGKAR